MTLPFGCYESIAAARNPAWGPLQVMWPMPGNATAVLTFAKFGDWREFLLGYGLKRTVPYIVSAKFERAQKLYLLIWIDADLVKAGELVALTALELAVIDRYAGVEKQRRIKIAIENAKKANKELTGGQQRWIDNISFADLLKYMVERDGLADGQLPLVKRCGPPSTVIGLLTGKTTPSLAEIRNGLAHGAPFDGFPKCGLFEVVRDLIDYAYRDFGV